VEFYFENLLSHLKNSLKDAGDVFLAAPYIKEHAITQLLEEMQPSATLKVFSRWLTNDIQNGSTDIEIYPLVKKHGGALYLHSSLHAKYFRFDKNFYAGSANLTGSGLQINAHGNLEVLSKGEKNVFTDEFESKLLSESHLVDDEIFEAYKEIPVIAKYDSMSIVEDFYWPSFDTVEGLWEIYLNGYNVDSIDLNKLNIPQNLEWKQFISFVRIRFLEFKNLSSIEVFLSSKADGRRFGEVRNFVRNLDPTVDETEIWKRLMNLYLELFPSRYEYLRPNYTEIIRPKQD
jgi:HKD family nuclease